MMFVLDMCLHVDRLYGPYECLLFSLVNISTLTSLIPLCLWSALPVISVLWGFYIVHKQYICIAMHPLDRIWC